MMPFRSKTVCYLHIAEGGVRSMEFQLLSKLNASMTLTA